MTEKLFYKDAYMFNFRANIVSSFEENEQYGVILDQTCFYPEGGGQPADTGWLNDIRVTDVQSRNGKIIHFIENNLPAGPVTGRVDKDRRLDLMQQHGGQHILSQALLQTGNHQTVSVHFGEHHTTIEIDAPSIAADDLIRAEGLANKIINCNLPVKIHWVKPEEVHKFNIRKPPPAVNKVRIVEIDGFDYSACGGTHVAQTGEIGFIKIVGREKLRGHIRLLIKIGKKAVTDYNLKISLVQKLMQTLTCGEEDIINRVADLQQQIKEKQREIVRLQTQLMTAQAVIALESASEIGKNKYVEKIFENVSGKMLKAFTDRIVSEPHRIVASFSCTDNQVRWVLAHSLGKNFDLQKIAKPLFSLIEARGGGNSSFLQGGANNPTGISEFLNQLKQKIEKELHT